MGGCLGALLRVARALGLFQVARRLTADNVRILCYHGAWQIDDGFRGDAMFILPETFERRLDTLERLGYPVISLSDAVDGLRGRRRLPASAVVLTIDDGWHSTWQVMAPAIARRKLPATLYCDTAHLMDHEPIAHLIALHMWKTARPALKTPVAEQTFDRARNRALNSDQRLAAARELAGLLDIDIEAYLASRAFHYMTPKQLRDIVPLGIDVQLHTHNHTMHDLSPDAILQEVIANRIVLTEVLGASHGNFDHFCYPSGVSSPEAAEALAAIGITSATTAVTGLASQASNPHLLPRIVDGDQISDLKFEAEMSGFMHLMRVLTGRTEERQQSRATVRGRLREAEVPVTEKA